MPRYAYSISLQMNDILKESNKRANTRQDTARCVPTFLILSPKAQRPSVPNLCSVFSIIQLVTHNLDVVLR